VQRTNQVLNRISKIASQPNSTLLGKVSSWMETKPNAPSSSAASGSATASSTGIAGLFGRLYSNTKAGIATTGVAATNAIASSTGVNGFQLSSMIAYVFAILCVLLIIVLFVHFFITPIFRLRPGTPGLIPVPGFDDGILYWSSSSALLPNASLPIRSQFYGYSFHVDIFIENPLAFSPHPRLLFHRGGVPKEEPSGTTLLSILKRYNVAVALTPDTNDLIVSVLNKNHGMENSVLSNVPVQNPFRLSMVIMEQGMEVYLNGQLVKTRRFEAPPLDITGDIVPIPGLATLRQLKLWGRILSASEIREATPALTTAKDFNLGPIPSSTSCGDASAPLSDAASSAASSAASAASAASAIVDSSTMSSLSAPFFTRLGPGGRS
jgi:hypothetical protein